MKKWLLMMCSLCLALSTVACSNQKADAKDTVTIAKDMDVTSFDTSITADGMSFEVVASIIEGLYTFDKDGNVIPALAEDKSVSEDGKVHTFKLKDAKWSNGEPVTAHDFVFAWRRLADPATASEYNYMLGSGVAEIVNADDVIAGDKSVEELGVKALDDRTLEVTLTKAVPFFDSLMTFPSFFPQKESFVKEKGDLYGFSAENLLANGPFELVSWEYGSKITLVKNKNYYDVENVKVENLIFKIIKAVNTSVLDFEQGGNDFTKLTGELVDKYQSNEHYKNVLDGYLWYLAINFQTPGLENDHLRKALSKVIDKEQIVNAILKDGSIAADYFVPEKLATGPDGKDFRETSSIPKAYNVPEAQELWEKAKAELGVDSITFELMYEEEGSMKSIAEFIKSQIESNLPGVSIKLVSLPKKIRLDRMRQKDFQIGLTRWGPDYADPTTYLNLMVQGANYNYGSYESEQYNQLMKEVGDTDDMDVRWKKLQEAEKVLLEDVGVIPLYQVGGATLVRNSVEGIENHTVGVPYIYKNVVKLK